MTTDDNGPPTTHERRLDNGLTVIVREDHSAPVVCVVTRVEAGYFDEPDDVAGISHVLEHMFFKGTPRRGPGEIARETKNAGGYLNAGTIYDNTSYYTVLPSSSLEQALDIQADAFRNSLIDADELSRELLVIIQEAKRKLDNPSAVAQEKLFELLFDAHRIRRWRIGTEEVLQGLTRDALVEFYRTWYRAANTVVVIAGDVDPGEAFGLAEQYYGDMAAGAPERDRGPVDAADPGFRYRELSGDISQAYLDWGWRAPALTHEDAPALDVLAAVLGMGRSSRLYRHVRDTGAASGVHAYSYTPGSIGVFGLGAEGGAEDIERAMKRIAAVVAETRAHGVTAAEVERAQNVLDARYIRRLETAEGQARHLADWQARGDWRMGDDYRRRMMAASAEDVSRVARTWLDPEQMAVLLYRPRTAPEFAADASAARRRIFEDTPSLDAVSASTPPALPAAPATVLTPRHTEDEVHFYEPGERLRGLVIRPRHTAPLVSMSIAFRGPVLTETAETAGWTGLMARASLRGTRRRTATAFAEEAEARGVVVSPSAGADVLEWHASIPARHLERGIDLLLEAALEPLLDDAEVERERKVALSDLEQLRDDMHAYPMRLALAAGFGGAGYGREPDTLEAALRSVDADRLRAWHRTHVLGGVPLLTVVGDVADPDALAALILDRVRPHLTGGSAPEPVAPQWAESPENRVEQRDRAQTALAIAFPGPARTAPDRYSLQVLSAAVGGLGGRLFEELRSRRSLAYSVSAAPFVRWLAGAFIAYIGMAPEREDEAREQLLTQLVALGREPLPADEVERAQRYLIGSWRIHRQTQSSRLGDLVDALLLGDGLAEIRAYEDRIAAVSPESVRTAAERWLRPDAAVEAVVRGTPAAPIFAAGNDNGAKA